jgi:hypothetical protein
MTLEATEIRMPRTAIEITTTVIDGEYFEKDVMMKSRNLKEICRKNGADIHAAMRTKWIASVMTGWWNAWMTSIGRGIGQTIDGNTTATRQT